MDISTWLMACWITLSTTVGIPSRRFLPLSLGIATLLSGFGRCVPSMIEPISLSRWACRYGRSASTSIRSIPPAPPFLFTCIYALFRLFGDTISSNRFLNVGCTVTSDFSLIHMKVCANHLSSDSVLLLLGQPSTNDDVFCFLHFIK